MGQTKIKAIVLAMLAIGVLLASSAPMAQQLYKWVGADGKTNYTDTPPPASAKRAESKGALGSGDDAVSLPYELAQAAKIYPVTLYTSTACAPCDNGRALLSLRGIPYAEKTVTSADDVQRFKQAGGDGTMPMLLVGKNKQIGFESGAWQTALTAAGYPDSSKLPQGYRNPAATAAAPAASTTSATPAKAARTGPSATSEASRTAPPANSVANPGFRF